MNRVDSKKAIQAFTLLESAVVLAALAIIAMFVVFPMLSNRRTYKGYCVNNLKNVGLELWRHFTVLSNEVSTKVLSCPKDTRKATSFDWQSVITNDHNRAISYTLGLDATEEEPQSILSSDRNLTLDGLPVGVAILTLRSNSPVGFHTNLHNLAGNVLFGDGSVQQVTQMVTNAVGSSNSRNIRIVVP
jgi:prepilin-type N-terminal cleavage/methylation domain-containing protein/prepilin-type processing-associated H-X9-DG protein